MSDTMPRTTPARHYRQPSRLAKHAAASCGVKPGTAEQWLHGHNPLPARFYALLNAAFVTGDDARAADLLSPIYELLGRHFPGECTEEIEIAELRAGHLEDEHSLRYVQQKSAERAAARITAIDQAVFQLLRKRAALRSEWGLGA